MTNEEAIKEMRKLERCHHEKPNGDADLKAYSAFRIAICSIEAQIPKKPGTLNGMQYCATCATAITKRILMGWEKYCPDCGQRVDWREE